MVFSQSRALPNLAQINTACGLDMLQMTLDPLPQLVIQRACGGGKGGVLLPEHLQLVGASVQMPVCACSRASRTESRHSIGRRTCGKESDIL